VRLTGYGPNALVLLTYVVPSGRRSMRIPAAAIDTSRRRRPALGCMARRLGVFTVDSIGTRTIPGVVQVTSRSAARRVPLPERAAFRGQARKQRSRSPSFAVLRVERGDPVKDAREARPVGKEHRSAAPCG